jgi:hypothetical protein
MKNLFLIIVLCLFYSCQDLPEPPFIGTWKITWSNVNSVQDGTLTILKSSKQGASFTLVGNYLFSGQTYKLTGVLENSLSGNYQWNPVEILGNDPSGSYKLTLSNKNLFIGDYYQPAGSNTKVRSVRGEKIN